LYIEIAEVNSLRVLKGIETSTVMASLDTAFLPYIIQTQILVSQITMYIESTPLMSSLQIQSGNIIKNTNEVCELLQSYTDRITSYITTISNHQQIKIMLYLEDIYKSDNRLNEEVTNGLDMDILTSDIKTRGDIQHADITLNELYVRVIDHMKTFVNGQIDGNIESRPGIDLLDFQIHSKNISPELASQTSMSTNPTLALPMKAFKSDIKKMIQNAQIATSPAKSNTSSAENNGKEKDDAKPRSKKLSRIARSLRKSTRNPNTNILVSSLRNEVILGVDTERLQGYTSRDRAIQSAIGLCGGISLGFLGVCNEATEKIFGLPSNDHQVVAYIHSLKESRTQLVTIDSEWTPAINESKLALYMAIIQLGALLGLKKDTTTYVEKYQEGASKLGDPWYIAYGIKLSLDIEEWTNAISIATAPITDQGKRLQGLLSITKQYIQVAKSCIPRDEELMCDGRKRLINLYTEISALPDVFASSTFNNASKDNNKTSENSSGGVDIDTLMKTISQLSAAEIIQLENTDMIWLRKYSLVLAKIQMAELIEDMNKYVSPSDEK
jgi:hypothetical protein